MQCVERGGGRGEGEGGRGRGEGRGGESSLVPSPHVPPGGEKWSGEQSNFLGLLPKSGKDQ